MNFLSKVYRPLAKHTGDGAAILKCLDTPDSSVRFVSLSFLYKPQKTGLPFSPDPLKIIYFAFTADMDFVCIPGHGTVLYSAILLSLIHI